MIHVTHVDPSPIIVNAGGANLTADGSDVSLGVQVTDPGADDTYTYAWTATNNHTQLSGTECGIGVNTTNPTVSTAGEGEPSCK